MKILRDNKQFCPAILTDLSKPFVCIPYDLIIAKLNGFDQEALKLIHSYLCDRSQKVKKLYNCKYDKFKKCFT